MTWMHEHADTLLGAFLGVLFSIPVAFYLSLYSGLLVARSARFEDLRYELIRILQSLEWPIGSTTFQLTGGHRAYDIVLISSDLIPLGHATAAKIVLRIGNEVANELVRRTDSLTPDQIEEQFTTWMRAARTMKPSRWVILDPRPRLHKTVKYDKTPS